MHINLFVYGTLLWGQSNHHYLENAEFLGEDAIGNACLIDLGAYPMLQPGNISIEGEVYRVSTGILAQIDELEEHPIVYQRQIATLVSGQQAWVYWGQSAYALGHPVITSSSWRRHLGNCKE